MPQPKRRLKPATIVDVAALAGVSKSTVSNVIRRRENQVAESTRIRVLEAIERLDYRPNNLARQFVSQRTTLLGVLVGDLDNPYYAQLGKRLERCAFRQGYMTTFCNIEGDDELALAGVDALLEQHVAGVVFLALFGRTPDVRDRLRDQVPVMFIGLREDWADSIAVDDAPALSLGVDHLLRLGHRRIAYLTSPSVEPQTDQAREAGYRSAMRVAGCDPMPPIRWAAGREDAQVEGEQARLLEFLLGPRSPTAVVTSNDMAALALLDLLDRSRYRVPEHFSVVGFDNVSIAGLQRVSLTTVAQPFDDLAVRGVDQLVARIEGHATGAPRHMEACAELVVRRSTGPPNARRGSKQPAS